MRESDSRRNEKGYRTSSPRRWSETRAPLSLAQSSPELWIMAAVGAADKLKLRDDGGLVRRTGRGRWGRR